MHSFYIVLAICCACFAPGVVSSQIKTPFTNQDSLIQIRSNFDCGSIGQLTQISTNMLIGSTHHWKHATSSDDQYYWFYVMLDHVKNKNVTIRLDSLSGTYRGGPHLIYTPGTQPVYSYDNQTWRRITDVVYDSVAHSLTFSNQFIRDSVWIAYAHPYSFQRETAFVNSLPKNSRFLTTEIIGRSAESRPIRLLSITDPASSPGDKKVVLITTLQHAGEFIGGYFGEGMINYLLSNEPDATAARKKIVYKIIPMMNPDGIYHGMTRFNASYEDLNQEWDDDFTDTLHQPTEPEVATVKKWLRNWIASGKKIDLALDVHSQGQQGTSNILHTPPEVLKGLAEKLSKYWPVEHIELTFSGSANDCLSNEFHIPAGTFEIPQSTASGGAYLTIENYRQYGKGTVRGLTNYLFASDERPPVTRSK